MTPEFTPPQYGWGRFFLSEVVPERASQSRSWNSQSTGGISELLKPQEISTCRSVVQAHLVTPLEPQNSQSDYFYCLTLSGRLFFVPFSLMKLAWWSWASGYQTNLSLCFVGKLLPD